mmetsp:Transcript_12097/g.33995  ORF Transcript_12097/g.33995 Transcript_12097/m.33995 type:complete len:550 (+) Transcript_12097:172-1821(+)|eukprot:CAMPEP_0117670232 /NCGR_PEP_ID=MMETSP0804-20121206/12622_1 /TAXON_ID=1074897 /ORGANISM="Tetraselmis astigmatica, Strain CCMP880" /LENGTH=549 /DNA_ID=CAMNT_0005478475 /DNA_START=117 /DNA_END=1766 /DNA_ORIENTATION=+
MEDEGGALVELHDEMAADTPKAARSKRRINEDSMDTGEAKRHATHEVVLRLLCPTTLSGSIIGKGGSSIQAMRAGTGARIQMESPVAGCAERVITIAAEDTPYQALCPSQSGLLRVVEKLGEAADEDDETFAVRLLLYGSQRGSLIGRGGQVINELRTSTGTTIRVLDDVPACGLPDDNVCQIMGPFPRVIRAVQAVSDKLRASIPRQKSGSMQAMDASPSGGYGSLPGRALLLPPGAAYGGLPGQGYPSHPAMFLQRGPAGMAPFAAASGVTGGASSITFRVLVPSARAGTIIGRGGEVIKKLRDETGAKVNMANSVDGCDWRVVELTSSEDGMAPYCAALEAVMRCMYLLNIEEATHGDSSIKLLVANGDMGAVLGKGGKTITALRQESGAVIRVGKETPPGVAQPDDEVVDVEGKLYSVESALRGICTCLRNGIVARNRAAGSGGGGGFHAAAGPGGTAVAVSSGPQETLRIHIRNDQVGGVIGKAGANISQIRQISGARVQIRDQEGADGNKEIEITGTMQECQAAQNLVQAFLWRSTGQPLKGA